MRKLSLVVAVSFASSGLTWAAELPRPTQTGLLSVYQQAVDNNADLAASRADYDARKEAVPQARAGLLPNISGSAQNSSTRTSIDQPRAVAT
ncbi:Type I secretion outer membrane protein, TolC, partial [Pseudomonas syringae pv. aptata]